MKTGAVVSTLVSAVLSIFVVLPIWLFLLYQILVKIQASELMWFLYWVYIPAVVAVNFLAQLAKTLTNED